MMCRVNSYNEKLDFTITRLLPRPCVQWLIDEDMLLLIVLQQAIPLAHGGWTCSSGSNIIEPSATRMWQLRTLEHAYSQALA